MILLWSALYVRRLLGLFVGSVFVECEAGGGGVVVHVGLGDFTLELAFAARNVVRYITFVIVFGGRGLGIVVARGVVLEQLRDVGAELVRWVFGLEVDLIVGVVRHEGEELDERSVEVDCWVAEDYAASETVDLNFVVCTALRDTDEIGRAS